MSDQQQKLEAVAALLGRPLPELAEQIWAVAEKVESLGNRGYDIETLQKAGLTTDFLENKEAWAASDKILFYRISDGKRDPFEGWMVRRKPSWQSVWCERYGSLNADDPHGCKALAAMSEAARKAKEEMIPRPSPDVVFAVASRVRTDDLRSQLEIANLLFHFFDRQGRDQHFAWLRATPYDTGSTRPPLSLAFPLHDLFAQWYREAAGELDWRLHMENPRAVRRNSAEIDHTYFPEDVRERIASGDITLRELAQVIIDFPIPDVPEVLHVDSDRWERIPADQKVYIGGKTRSHGKSIWAYPFKANKDENAAVRQRRYEDYLRGNADLLAQLEDLRGKRALGVTYGSPYYNYDEKPEIGNGEVLQRFLSMDEDKLHDLIQEAIEKAADKS